MTRERPLVWRILTNRRRFGLFFMGSALSNIGTWCQNIAAVILVYQMTGSTFMVGMVTVSQFLAPFLLAPLAGMVADRFDRRVILICAQLSAMLASGFLAILAFAGTDAVGLVLLAIGLLGVCQAFHSPAQLTIVPLLTDPEEREVALALNSTQFNLARAIGPVVASGLVVFGGPGTAFAFNAASYLLYAAFLCFIRPSPQTRPTAMPSLAGGFRALAAAPVVILLIASGTAISGATDVLNTLGPAVSTRLTGSPESVGLFATAFGIGAVATAFLVVPLLRRFRRRLMWLMLAQAAGTTVFAVAPTLWLALLGALLCGGAFIAASNRALSIVQNAVPAAVLGRVTALWLMGFLGGRVFFAALEGGAATLWSTQVAGVLVAMILVAAALSVHLAGPGLAARAA